MGEAPSAVADKQSNQPEILFEEDIERHALRLELLKNAHECRCSITPKSKEGQVTKEEIAELLAAHGITQGIDNGQIQAMCRTLAKGKTANNFLLAEGVQPAPGPDGYLELFVKTSSDLPDYAEAEDGTIDFRTLNFFSNVTPDQEIGILRPPELGEEGYTVRGDVLPAVPGKPLKLNVGAGARAEGDKVLADMEGRVLFDGKTVSVTEEYLVQGDVDLAVGNIDFRGFVQVRGDVLDDFDIHAVKGIQINGNVGMCHISCGGDIALGGMAGQGRGTLTCGGNLVVTYLNDVTVECEGDILVKNEIRNSRVYCSGTLTIANGNIFGGETYALGGIEAKNVGAVSGIKTRLYGGIDYVQIKLARELDEVQMEFIELNDELAILSQQLKLNRSLGPEDKKKVLALAKRLEEINQIKSEIGEKIVQARKFAEQHANGKINIKGRLGEGVVLHIGENAEEIKHERSGAVSIIENRKGSGFHFLSLTPLSKTAEALEEELQEEEAEEEVGGGEWGS
ncbi:hypothetical protein SAMN05660860_02522 [Geoalkalibacter ferrihydriticus]|uniref:Flagellar Assembly Protein A N-terminal region domain-containing protein n=1 Tax=Geoalkalibacter ferrihydriticus TaxID=392333 RepID=A0A1G9T8Q5_9BACT|nr:FapA family protein [Geoalkalibacter ferrihydriticus]SDM44037.1 hypothetical protein SAMN05660860_02522 [Geoalkalibacter ferrihydriticus]